MSKTKLLILFCSLAVARVADARLFNSTLPLKVYARGSGEVPDRLLGFTPSRKGHRIHIPETGIWYVRPIGPLDGDRLWRLAKLMRDEHVPGIDLSDHWELSNASMGILPVAGSLAMLDISRTKINDQGIKRLKSCRKLSVLMLPSAVTDEGLTALKTLHHLTELNLDQTKVTDHGVATLAHIPSLENIDLSSTRVTDAGVALLQSLPHLQRLVLGAAITDASARRLATLKSLHEIDVSQTQMGERGLTAIGSLPEVRTIYLPRQTNDAGLKGLSASPSIRALDLTRTAVTDTGIRYLSRMKTLEEVALGQTYVTNASLPYLAKLPNLRMLELSDTRITSAGLDPLAQLEKLEVLSLSWEKLTREDLQGMAKLKQLRTIVLNGAPLPETTMAQLKRLGSPSPWEPIEGLAHATYSEKPVPHADQTALSAPVAMPAAPAPSLNPAPPRTAPIPTLISKSPASGTGAPATAPVPTSTVVAMKPKTISGPDVKLPVHEELQAPSAPSRPETIVPAKPAAPTPSEKPVVSREQKGRGMTSPSAPSHKETTTVAPSTGPAAPTQVASKKDEENLLQVISLQSNPAHAGGFSGLSGMRQIRQTKSLAALNAITAGGQTAIEDNENKPENYLGEISVGASPSH